MIAIVATALVGILAILAILAVLAVGIAITVFWIWMLVDAIRNDRIGGWSRVLWTVLIWFTHIIGAVIYFFFGRRTSIRTA
ncbi:MAG TPA: PLDc N-terminal domain-containing protein [Candidatus Limnocylindria bacterium]|nr:PLDc N-terminal domain-containing protein [Candidatus Limnocylindria bacterium]